MVISFNGYILNGISNGEFHSLWLCFFNNFKLYSSDSSVYKDYVKSTSFSKQCAINYISRKAIQVK